jgi:hypothetical protein
MGDAFIKEYFLLSINNRPSLAQAAGGGTPPGRGSVWALMRSRLSQEMKGNELEVQGRGGGRGDKPRASERAEGQRRAQRRAEAPSQRV